MSCKTDRHSLWSCWPTEILHTTKFRVLDAIVLCLIAVRCNGNYFKGPSDTAVAEGTRATLNCQTSSSKTIWWRYEKTDIFYAYTISHDYKSSHESEVNVSNGIYSYNLIIRNASSHAGLYTCIDDDGGGERGSASLTVKANATAMETSSNHSTVKIVAIVVPLVVGLCLVIIVIALVIFFKRRQTSEQTDLNAAEEGRSLSPINIQSNGDEHREEQDVNGIEDTTAPTGAEHREEQGVSRIENTIAPTGSSVNGGSDEVAVQPEFNEADYLAGQFSVLGQNPLVPRSSRPAGKEEGKDETEGKDDESKKPFDEGAYLAGVSPLADGRIINRTQFNAGSDKTIDD